jgi:hypothetical protein
MCEPSASDFAAAPADTQSETEPHTKQTPRDAKPDTLDGRQ